MSEGLVRRGEDVELFPGPTRTMASRFDTKEKDRGVNVQVLLRCRPFNEEEIRANAPQVISCYEQKREVTVCQNIASKQIDRTFTFDKVFGPNSLQKDLFDQAVVPIVNEVLEGFNCTIFAYGQTGTGKTYTMEGAGRKAKQGELPVDAGVIPRSVQQIFDTLESQNAEYSVKVTFLELYNEEITDLLAPEEFSKVLDDKQKKPLALMEDGKGGVLVRGLEEEIVTSANEIYSLLDRGSAKRRTAETLLNKQSSRSHSIFSITIHIKEATPEGEELIKCGKLNLVDLAGSENISRSGAREGRAREAGEINKSLLTLGRVITALVEHLGHIPYRDSKLTRLLRDSLGGRTKTCIIATVSPSVHCLDETLSTLDYAHRAKNIRNKPEVNQKMMKSALIKDLYGEIERLKSEVFAAREKNGIYMPRERFLQDEADKKAMTEKIEQLEFELDSRDKQLDETQDLLDNQRKICGELTSKLEATQRTLEQTQDALLEAKDCIKQAQYSIKARDFVIVNHQRSENVLVDQAARIRSELDATAQDVAALFAKLGRKEKVESGNRQVLQNFQSALSAHVDALRSTIVGSVTQQQEYLRSMEEQVQSILAHKDQTAEELREKLKAMRSTYLSQLGVVHGVVNSHATLSSKTFEKLDSLVSSNASALEKLLVEAMAEAEVLLKGLQAALVEQQQEVALFAQQQREAAHKSLEATRSISAVIVSSVEDLEKRASELSTHIDESQADHDQRLAELAESYDNQARQEHDYLLAGITELLISSKTRQTDVVQKRVGSLRQHAEQAAKEYNGRLLDMRNVASGAHSRMDAHTKAAEDAAEETAAMLTTRHGRMEDLLQRCVLDATTAEVQWTSIQGCVAELEKNHVPEVAAVVRNGLGGNEVLVSRFDAVNASTQLQVDTSHAHIGDFIGATCDLEHVSTARLHTAIAAQSNAASHLQSLHDNSLDEIRGQTSYYLVESYKDDLPTCTTPSKRSIVIPSQAAIDELRTPSIESLLQEFRERNVPPQLERADPENATSREVKSYLSAENSVVRESRVPLTLLN